MHTESHLSNPASTFQQARQAGAPDCPGKRLRAPDFYAKTRQRTFILVAVFLLLLFFALLACNNTWGQTNICFLSGADYMMDMLNTENYASKLDPYGYIDESLRDFPHSNYPPLAYLIFFIIDQISHEGCWFIVL